MAGGSSKQTIGYKYNLGLHLGLAHGPLDSITQVYVDNRLAWELDALRDDGTFEVGDGTTLIEVNADELFGGDKREGGVSGTIDVEMGDPTQAPNDYLQTQLGDVPAFRGICSLVFRQVYMGNNPYLKPWSFIAQRIHTTTGGATQWQDILSAIARPFEDCYACDAFETAALTLSPIAHYKMYDRATTSDQIVSAINSPDMDYADIIDNNDSAHQAMPGDLALCTDQGVRLINGPNSSMIMNTGSPFDWPVAYQGGPDSNNVVGVSFVCLFSPTNTIQLTSTGQVNLRIAGYFGGAGIGTLLAHFAEMRAVITSTSPREVTYKPYIHTYNDGEPHVGVTLPDGTDSGVLIFTFSCENMPAGAEGFPTAWIKETSRVRFVNETTDQEVTSTYNFQISGENRTAVTSRQHNVQSVGTYANQFVFNRLISSSEESVLVSGYLNNIEGGACGCSDMNPAHIIRECLIDGVWGMGYTADDIDETSFASAAMALYSESFGISLLWDREVPLEDFIAEILKHIDGVLYVSRVTGKFVLKLIRDDYTDSNLVILDETNVSSIKDAKRPTLAELTSSVTVQYWDAENRQNASYTEHNYPIIQLQGAQTNSTIQYNGITHLALAQRVAIRDLKQLSTPLLSCMVVANREAADLNIGDAFILDWPDLGINNTVMRVQQMGLGDGRNNAIVIEALEDVFAMPDTRTSTTRGDSWTDPNDQTPLRAHPRVLQEAPYWELVRNSSQLNIDTILADEPDAGFVMYSAGRQNGEFNARSFYDAGTGYNESLLLDFGAYGYLTELIDETATQITITGATDTDAMTFPAIAQIDQELIRIDAITEDSNGTHLQVGRGILDTVPASHGLDSAIDSTVIDGGSSFPAVLDVGFAPTSNNIQYTAGDQVNAKLRTVWGQNTLALADAPADFVEFNSRAIRPYPPGNLKIDGEAYPEANTSSEIYWTSGHTISWSHRDRTQQTDDNLYDYTTGDIGPEAGTTYKIFIYSTLQNGDVTEPWWEIDAGSGNSYDMDSTAAPDSSRGDPPDGTETIHIKVTAYRGGYASWQSPVATLSYESDSTS